ncbi:MAG: 2-amino-4-hydroxy-6-hydroxymethyldihydropteridine diphosphokinase [Bacteroidaceae bacterium]
MHNLYLALGSNLGKRHDNIMRALELIDQRVGAVYRVSSLIETEPWGFSSPNRFVNAVCLVHTMLSPRLCLEETQLIEREMGRTEKSSEEGGYADRIIDIDLLMYDHLEMEEDGLVLPHPHMQERDFVMGPLREVMGKP